MYGLVSCVGKYAFDDQPSPLLPQEAHLPLEFLQSLSQRQLQHFAFRHEVAHAIPENRDRSNGHPDRTKDPGEVHATTIAYDWAKKVFDK